MKAKWILLISTTLYVVAVANAADFSDKQADVDALPTVPAAFEVTLFAREPLVRQPCSMAFDARGRLSKMQETRTAWTLGRIAIDDATIDQFFAQLRANGSKARASLNLRIQAARILDERSRRGASFAGLDDALRRSLVDDEPRVRMAAVQAVLRAGRGSLYGELCELLERKSDATVFYAGWQTLRRLLSTTDLRSLLDDPRGPVQRAAFLALLETHSLSRQKVAGALAEPTFREVREIAELWKAKAGSGAAERVIRGRPIDAPAAPSEALSNDGVAAVGQPATKSRHTYRIQPGGLRPGVAAYSDRNDRFKTVPDELVGLDLVQTANNDDGSRGDDCRRDHRVLEDVPARLCPSDHDQIPLDHRVAFLAAVQTHFVDPRLVLAVGDFIEAGRLRQPCPGQFGDGRHSRPCSARSFDHNTRCFCQQISADTGRSIFSWIGSRPVATSGKNKICSWMSAAKCSRFMIWVIRGCVTLASWASSLWSETTPSRSRPSNRIANAINLATRGTRPAGVGAAAGSSTIRRRPALLRVNRTFCFILIMLPPRADVRPAS